MYAHIYKCTCAMGTHMCIHIYMYTCACIYTHAHTSTCDCICIVHVYAHTHEIMCIYTCTNTYSPVYSCTYMYTHTHALTHRHCSLSLPGAVLWALPNHFALLVCPPGPPCTLIMVSAVWQLADLAFKGK